jgi:hypothetical protein
MMVWASLRRGIRESIVDAIVEPREVAQALEVQNHELKDHNLLLQGGPLDLRSYLPEVEVTANSTVYMHFGVGGENERGCIINEDGLIIMNMIWTRNLILILALEQRLHPLPYQRNMNGVYKIIY